MSMIPIEQDAALTDILEELMSSFPLSIGRNRDWIGWTPAESVRSACLRALIEAWKVGRGKED